MDPEWIRLGHIDSTNNWINRYLKQEPAAVNLVVIADYQEYGRGQGENRWVSREGENLLMSLLLYPAFLSASQQFKLSMMVSLAITDFLGSAGVDPLIKWPNDLVTRSGKIAGILIELGVRGTSLTHAIIGIGLNINQDDFPEFRIPATSLLLETGRKTLPEEAANDLVGRLSEWYETIRTGDFRRVEQAYHEKLYGLNETITLEARPDRPGNLSVKGPAGQKERSAILPEHTGILRGVNEYGELLLELQGDGIRAFSSGIVRMKQGSK
jgi:BirA family transcriptional regulator, biotin operon repressor / biotin---[acetyl-CoA-carboxylase] ligase